jgi:hypothetical protein
MASESDSSVQQTKFKATGVIDTAVIDPEGFLRDLSERPGVHINGWETMPLSEPAATQAAESA